MTYFAERKVGIVLDNGALFRGGKEEIIRKAFIEKDLIEAVFLLPEKLFYNTPAQGIVLILNKNKPEERKGKVLFINASQEYEKHPEIRRLNILTEEGIKKIVEAYKQFESIEGFSRVISAREIASNGYNLNVTLYVMPIEEREEISIVEEFSELKRLEKERQEVMEKLERYISEISKAMGS